MGRRFGKIQQLPSGNWPASATPPPAPPWIYQHAASDRNHAIAHALDTAAQAARAAQTTNKDAETAQPADPQSAEAPPTAPTP
jgi:hypothetical protein